MKPRYKLIRFSNGEQVIGEVLEENDTTVTVRNLFRAVNKESRHGYITSVVKWLTYIEEDTIIIKKDHITFLTSVGKEIEEYLKERENEDDSYESMEEMEKEYKKAQLETYLRYANTYPTMQ